MSVRVYPGDQITLAMNFAGNQAQAQSVADRLATSYPQYTFHIVDIYTMSPTVLWVAPPESDWAPPAEPPEALLKVIDGETVPPPAEAADE